MFCTRTVFKIPEQVTECIKLSWFARTDNINIDHSVPFRYSFLMNESRRFELTNLTTKHWKKNKKQSGMSASATTWIANLKKRSKYKKGVLHVYDNCTHVICKWSLFRYFIKIVDGLFSVRYRFDFSTTPSHYKGFIEFDHVPTKIFTHNIKR